MKIGIDIRAIGRQRTGDETYTLNLVKNLLKIDRKNQYWLYTNTKNPQELAKIKTTIGEELIKNSNAQIASVLPANKALWTFFALSKFIAKNPVDILHVQYITPQILPKKIKLITTIHDVSFERFGRYIKWSDLFFLKTLIPSSLLRADKIIGVSYFTAREIASCYTYLNLKEKIRAIPNGGANEMFSKEISTQELAEFKALKKIPDNFVFYFGTLQPRKNIPALIQAFFDLKKENLNNKIFDDWQLLIGGKIKGHNVDQEIFTLYEKLKKENPQITDRIKFLDYVSNKDLVPTLKLAKVFCFPSLYEGFGLPIIEAMTTGGPAVLCSANGCHEEIAADAALYFDPNNKPDLKNQLAKIMQDDKLRNDLKQKTKDVVENFSWKKCARETLAVYEEACQE